MSDLGAEVLPAPQREEVWLQQRMLSVRRVARGGTPAVLIHGLGGSSLNWTDLAFQLGGRLDSWAVDLPGFGASPPPRDGNYSPGGHARAVLDLVIERIGRPVHVFGNSLGGAVGLQLAARAPAWVRSLTLVSPALPGNKVTRHNAHLPVVAVPGLGDQLLRRYLRVPAAARVRATVEACYADVNRVPPVRLAEAVEETERRDALTYTADSIVRSARGLLRSMVDRAPDRPLVLAGKVECPVLLVYGGEDRLVSAAGARRVAAAFRDARLVVLPDCGHVAQMEHPELVAGAWRDMMGSRSTPPRGK